MSTESDHPGKPDLRERVESFDSLTDGEIYRCVVTTLRDVILPALPPEAEWARVVTVQLAGLARYAQTRGADQTAARVDELANVLDDLRRNALVAANWNGKRDQLSVMTAVGAILAAAITDVDDASAIEVRARVRPVVVRHLDDELASTAPLVGAFRGRLDD